MLFNKELLEVNYDDICKLKKQKIEESEILDYKKEYETKEHENNLLKEVTAFSNSSGGFLVYGIQESGKGGYPAAIDGIDDCDTDRLEQVIISNVIPRIGVKIKSIDVPGKPGKIILIIYIPEGQTQPYYNNRANKFYKRYNFEAKEMDEHEIEALYQKRFFGISNLSRYVNEAVSFNRNFISVDKRSKVMDCHIIISPLRVEDRIINTTDSIGRELRDLFVKDLHSSEYLYGLVKPSKFGVKWVDSSMSRIVEVHRNGLVYCMGTCGNLDDKDIFQFSEGDFSYYLLNTISFATIVYSKFNYLGKVKIIAKILNCADSAFFISSYMLRREPYKCDTEEIIVEREWDSWKLKEDRLKIGKSIMDEVANCYGLWESQPLIEKN